MDLNWRRSSEGHTIFPFRGGDPEKKIYKMLEFAGDGWKELKAGKRNPDKVPDVADPWYTGNFDNTWRDVTAGCQGLLKFLL